MHTDPMRRTQGRASRWPFIRGFPPAARRSGIGIATLPMRPADTLASTIALPVLEYTHTCTHRRYNLTSPWASRAVGSGIYCPSTSSYLSPWWPCDRHGTGVPRTSVVGRARHAGNRQRTTIRRNEFNAQKSSLYLARSIICPVPRHRKWPLICTTSYFAREAKYRYGTCSSGRLDSTIP